MAYSVSEEYKRVIYSGGAVHKAILTINGIEISNSQIESIEISDPLIDNQQKFFYLGQFASKQLIIKFKNTDGIPVEGNVELSIGTLVNEEWEIVPIGKFLIETNTEDYYTNSKLTCLDYAVKMKSNCDFSSLIVADDGKITPITLENLLKWICQHYGVELGEYPNINKDYLVSTYDTTMSGKYYISLIAELMASNAHIGRDGKLYIIPIKQSSREQINALKSELFNTTSTYTISKVIFDDGIRKVEKGNDEKNTLFIRNDNMFVLENVEELINNIYQSVNGIRIDSVKTKNYGDVSLDPFDFVTYTLDENSYVTLYNNKITYQQTLMGTVETVIPTETQTSTTNVYDTTDEKGKIRKIQTQVNQVDASLKIVAQETDEANEKISTLTISLDEIRGEVSNTTEVVGDLENSISYFSVELAQNSITIPTSNTNIPLATKTYEIPYYGYFKGKQVIPNVSISGSNTGITASYSTTALKFAVKDDTAIANISNNYSVTFTYFYGGANYTTTKNITIALAPKGTDGTSVNILGSYDSYEELKQAHPTGNIGDAYIVQGDMYVWNVEEQDWVDVGDIQGPAGSPGKDGTNGKSAYQIWLDNGNVGTEEEYLASLKGEKGEDGVTPVKGVDYFDGDDGKSAYQLWLDAGNTGTEQDYLESLQGEDGTSYYTHIRYSSNANGSGMSSSPTGKKYIGVYSGTSKDAPTSYTSYTWSKYVGDDGQDGSDGNGINSITYTYAVTKDQTTPSASNITSSTIPTLTPTNKYLWQKEVIDFTDSAVADKTTILLLAVYGDSGQDGYTPVKGVDYFDGYTPIKGVDYFDGNNGTSTYFYVRYSANSNGSGMTTTPQTNTKYMGTASTTSPTAPTSASAYTWVETKGADGSPGQPGSNGLTSYLHIKYSEDGVTFTPADDEYTLGKKPSAWIGQYVDYTEADSENFEDYTWYKFTEDIDDTLSGMQEDISNNKTDIENTKQDLLEELNKKASNEIVSTIINDVKTLQDSTSYAITIAEEIQRDGVTQVRTENNYTFNKDGLIIEETGAKTKGIFDNKGVDIIDTQGDGTDLLYAGYVDEEKADSNEKLKQFEGQTVVYSDNMYVGNYLMIGTHSRLEDFEDGTGVFYLGG